MKDTIKNICIFGIGGVGGYFGGRIASTITRDGDEARKVFFIARGRHLQEIKRNGLLLNTPQQAGMVCKPSLATDNIGEIPAPDLCLMCVKSYDLSTAGTALAKNIRDNTVIIPLLNGVDIYERMRENVSMGIVLPSCVYVSSSRETPGVVTQRGNQGVIVCGGDPHYPDFDPAEVVDLFNQAGITFQWHEDPYPAIWEKFIFIASFALVTAHAGKTLGEVMSDTRLQELTRSIIEEIVSIAQRLGIKLPEDIVLSSLNKATIFPFETKTSYQRDIEEKGRHEGDLFGGTIVRMGKRLGVSTPVTQSVYEDIQGKIE